METTFENHGLLKRFQIMVVDDDTVSLRVITRILSTFQCEVLPFDDVYEALCTLREQRGKFDLLLLEICLIGSENFDMLKHFVNVLDLPIITMCAYDDDKIRHESLSHGVCLHLTKPITITDIGVVSQKAWFKSERKEQRSESLGSQPKVEEIGHAGHSSSSKTLKGGSSEKNEFIWTRQEGGGSEKPKKARLEWDFEIHQRFLLATALVGERAPPSRIYELMGVEGLTLRQASNHLQRHRSHLRKWKRATEIHPQREIRPMPAFTQPIFAPFITAPYPPMHWSGWTHPASHLSPSLGGSTYAYQMNQGSTRVVSQQTMMANDPSRNQLPGYSHHAEPEWTSSASTTPNQYDAEAPRSNLMGRWASKISVSAEPDGASLARTNLTCLDNLTQEQPFHTADVLLVPEASSDDQLHESSSVDKNTTDDMAALKKFPSTDEPRNAVDVADESSPAADDIDDIFDARNYVFDEAAIAKMLDDITREHDTTP